MGLIQFLLFFALLGFCAYLILTYIPMPAPMKQVLVVVLVVVLILWVAQMLLGEGGGSLRLPSLRTN